MSVENRGGDERFGWESWTWDDTLFKGSAPFYRRGRSPYAPGTAATIAAVVGLDGSGRLLDVGCGPGIVTLLLASLFEQVVGLDPDAGMLDAAAQAALGLGVTNAAWVLKRAEELPGDLGTFRVITFAQSFHWMDRERVAAAVRSMLDPGGAVVQVDGPRPTPGTALPEGPHPPIPNAEIDALTRRYLGADRRAGQGYRNTSPSGEDAIFQAAGFHPEETFFLPDPRVLERSTDDVVASVFSMSSSAPHLFGGGLAAYERDLRALLGAASPTGWFSVPLGANSVRVRRPA